MAFDIEKFNQHMEQVYLNTIKDCSILNVDDCCTWCVGRGWTQIVSDFCYECEMLNIQFYDKYRIRIHIDQIKEKFGTLRIYTSVVIDPNKYIMKIKTFIDKIITKLNNKNYNLEQIVDIPSHTKTIFKISKHKTGDCEKKINNYYVDTKNVFTFPQTHMIPRNNKFSYWCMKSLEKISKLLYSVKSYSDISRLNVIRTYIETQVQNLTSKYERQSKDICEYCGKELNKDRKKRCTTIGWIKTICLDCAKSGDQHYMIGGKEYYKGQLISTNGENNAK